MSVFWLPKSAHIIVRIASEEKVILHKKLGKGR